MRVQDKVVLHRSVTTPLSAAPKRRRRQRKGAFELASGGPTTKWTAFGHHRRLAAMVTRTRTNL